MSSFFPPDASFLGECCSFFGEWFSFFSFLGEWFSFFWEWFSFLGEWFSFLGEWFSFLGDTFRLAVGVEGFELAPSRNFSFSSSGRAIQRFKIILFSCPRCNQFGLKEATYQKQEIILTCCSSARWGCFSFSPEAIVAAKRFNAGKGIFVVFLGFAEAPSIGLAAAVARS